MFLLPRHWNVGTVRTVIGIGAWGLVLLGLWGGYREGCGTEGWGAYIVLWGGLFVNALLAATENGLTLITRLLWVVAALLALPVSAFGLAALKGLLLQANCA